MTIKNEQEKQVENEIKQLLNELQNYEDIDPAYLPEDLKELRHKIIHVHLRLEISLDILMGSYVLQGIEAFMLGKKVYDKSVLQMTRFDMQKILDAIDYSRKVKVAKQMKKIDQNMEGHLYKVNDLRLIFSHPTAYHDKIMEYKDRQKYKQALQTLKEAYQAMNDVMRKESKRQLDKEVIAKIEKNKNNI